MADGWTDEPEKGGGIARKFATHPAMFIPENEAELLRFAENELLSSDPNSSCRLGVLPSQSRRLAQIGSICGLLAIALPQMVFLMISGIAFLVFSMLIAQRLMLVVVGALSGVKVAHADGAKGWKPRIWPVYSILVPVYREPQTIGQLVKALEGLDYPKRQLDIIILLEEGDIDTLEAVLGLTLKSYFRVICVPEGQIRTKPRALNYGLQMARGQYVAIYDAEDQMHESQLKAAVEAFQSDRIANGQPPLACVQAPLVPHNGRESWIAGQFAQEYAIQFGLLVPGLTDLKLPVPLGGTSNHFDKRVLETIGGWDPFNVTEDADLGLRIARAGYRVGSIVPPTFEEAPVGLLQWVRQRSRWIKGYIQTLGVFLRSPGEVIGQLGVWGFLNAACLLGGVALSAMCHGPFLAVLVLCAVLPGLSLPFAAIPLLVSGLCAHIAAVLLAQRKWTPQSLVSMLTAPVYWPLQSLAAGKAIWELFTRPYYWDKTEHGLCESMLEPTRLRA